MQPEQDIDIPNRPIARRRPVAARPASAAGSGESVQVDNGPTFGNGASVVGAKGGGKTGWVLAIILLLLIAAGGVGFGVWAYMDGDNTKNNLNTEISVLKEQNNALKNENTVLKENIEVYESIMSRNGRVITTEIDETKSLDRGGAKAEVIEGKFYVKDSKDEEIIHDDVVGVTEIVSCKTELIEEHSSLICEVLTLYGQGKYVYTYGEGYDVLKYTLDSWSDETQNNVDTEDVLEDDYMLDSK